MERSYTLADTAVFFPAQYENLQKKYTQGFAMGIKRDENMSSSIVY